MRTKMLRYQKYVNGYTEFHTENNRLCGLSCDEPFIKDMLYGLGTAIDPIGYSHADGYHAWMVELHEMITKYLDKESMNRL